MYDMPGWTPDVSQWTIISTGFIQGASLGFLFLPLLAAIPLVLWPRKPGTPAKIDHSAAME